MKLHNNSSKFLDLIKVVSQTKEISENLVEKDYWVSYALKKISNSEFSDKLVFKGGTSLSKSYNIIDRFSEDIDLHLFDVEDYGDSRRKNLFQNIEKVIAEDENFEYIENHKEESKHGNIRKTVYEYPLKIDKPFNRQLSKRIILEISNLGNPVPIEKRKVTNFVYEFLKENDHESDIKKYKVKPFRMKVLDYKRTFVEKLFAILDKTMQDDVIEGLREYIRHIYDLYKLYQVKEINNFINNKKERNNMFSRVVKENDFFGNRKKYKYFTSCLVENCKEVMEKIKKEYSNNFKILVYGELPKFDEVVNLLEKMVCLVVKWEKGNREYYKN